MRRIRSIPMAIAFVVLANGAGGVEAQSRQSWTSDRRDFVTGDVITVLIDEHTLASANQGNFASDRRFRDLGVGVSQTATAAIPNVRGQVGSSNQAESRQRGEATRQNRFQGEMTVRVVGVEEGGLLRIEGNKVVDIDRNAEELTLRGVIRPQDVTSGNMIDSWRVADAELVYTARGRLGRPRGGIVGRVLAAIWP
jgi:flagellar L-ring protein FlgH